MLLCASRHNNADTKNYGAILRHFIVDATLVCFCPARNVVIPIHLDVRRSPVPWAIDTTDTFPFIAQGTGLLQLYTKKHTGVPLVFLLSAEFSFGILIALLYNQTTQVNFSGDSHGC